MRRQWHWASALLFSAMSGAAAADSLDLNLHEEAARLTYAFSPQERRGLEADIGYYFNEDDEYITHAGVHVSGENWSEGGVFDIGVGGRIVYVNTDDFDEAALAVGARVRFSPVKRVGFGGAIYYAPKIVTSLDGENYLEASVNADYQLLPQAFVYLGYRFIEVDFDEAKDVELDDSAHIGLKLTF